MSEYKFPFFDDNGKVICQGCGESFLSIAPRHIKKCCGLSFSEYKSKYPDAPLTSEQFNKMSKYGKVTDLFQETIIAAQELIEEQPEIPDEEILKQGIVPKKIKKNMFEQKKDEIQQILQKYLPSVQQNYEINEYTLTGHLLLYAITDFADPILKINVEFPDTFWHNRLQYVVPQRTYHLKRCGWKVIEIKGNAPTKEQIEKEIKKHF